VFKAGESQGKSGSFFFFSHDRKFIIKTMFQAELDVAMQKLQNYCEYISSNPDSLIARIYGIYQVEMEGVVPISLLLMANTI
jgi:1-phosphatidylinositol-4-phosphate 5-kinase